MKSSDGAQVLVGVANGDGQGIVSVATNGTATARTATVEFTVGAGGNVIARLSNVTWK